MPKKTITICCSVSFYKKALDLAAELSSLGFKAKVPDTAILMNKNKDFTVSHYKTWYKNFQDYHKKTKLMKGHFKKVVESDAILVANFKKNKMPGYIGGNTLMEMAIAFHHKKPIYILNKIDSKLPLKEEVFGVQPIFINGNLSKIKK